MKKTIILFAVAFSVSAWAQTYVQPHVTKNGTYVEGHMRSNQNDTRMDNYSTKGNKNPYTGQAGTVNPYAQPAPSYQQQPQSRQSGYGQQQCGVAANGQYTCR